MKVKIVNSGEDSVSIIREITKEQYDFLLSVVEDLDAECICYAPSLRIECLN